MAYDAVTPAAFKTAKPQFSSVVDGTVQDYLDLAGVMIDRSWVESAYQPAVIAYTCHLMTLDGLGTDSESKAQRDGTADFQEIRSGQLTLKRFADSAAGSSYMDWLRSTECGRMFSHLLRMNKGGPRVAMGASRSSVSAYAKDWPLAFYVG